MTEKSLKRNHKSYCTWHHRKWTVQRYAAHFPAAAPAVLARELALCGKLLQMDERNFHCWGYRRRVQDVRHAEAHIFPCRPRYAPLPKSI